MGYLTSGQKVVLGKLLCKNEPDEEQKRFHQKKNPISCWNKLPKEIVSELNLINDSKFLEKDVNSFIAEWREDKLTS